MNQQAVLCVCHSLTVYSSCTEEEHDQMFLLLHSNNVHHVSQFHINKWASEGSCSNLRTVTDVIEEVSKVQRRTDNQSIVMHCR